MNISNMNISKDKSKIRLPIMIPDPSYSGLAMWSYDGTNLLFHKKGGVPGWKIINHVLFTPERIKAINKLILAFESYEFVGGE